MSGGVEPRLDDRWLQTVQRGLRGLYGGASDAALETIADLPRGADRYTQLREIARGGMSVVWEVSDTSLQRTLAMKIAGAGAGDAQRLLEEAQIVARLDHPGVVPVYEIGVDARGAAFLTMRRIDGRPLSALLEDHRAGRAPLVAVLEVLLKVCDTLAFAHRRGVAHCDVKPANVMVGDFGAAYLVDWGLAVVLDDDGSRVRREVAGTPSYMAPECAAGGSVGAAADVYSVGAMLYELLAARPPYAGEDAPGEMADLLEHIAEHPPAPVRRWSAGAPSELVAICELAMQREVAARYPSAEVLAADLRAFLEGRVVQAHRTGLGPELRAWVRRNPAFAAVIGVGATTLLLASLLFVSALEEERDRARELQELAEQRLVEITEFALLERVGDLRRRADEELWPAHPDHIEPMRAWLAEAYDVLVVFDEIDAQPDAQGFGGGPDAAWRVQRLAETVRVVREFRGGEGAITAGLTLGSTIPEVQRRLAFAEELRARGADPVLVQRWAEERAAIAAHEAYGGLQLDPQVGLVPLGADPATGLHEFAHLQSGDPPARDARGELVMTDASAIVLVLLPGGAFSMGAQRDTGPNRDPQAEELNETPVERVELAPFYVAKFEATQGQWRRLTGGNPSNHRASSLYVDEDLAPRHPVESVSWHEARRVASRVGLDLPTEAQWEYACRAGTDTPWWCGVSVEDVTGNLADRSRADALQAQAGECESEFEDGFVMHAPVGSFAPNAFGLHDVIGNVWEWCRDEYVSYAIPVGPGDGARPLSEVPELAMYRGGAFDQLAVEARSANRAGRPPESRMFSIGVRMARPVE